MDITPLFEFSDRAELRQWLEENHGTTPFCWVATTRGKGNPNEEDSEYKASIELLYGIVCTTRSISPTLGKPLPTNSRPSSVSEIGKLPLMAETVIINQV